MENIRASSSTDVKKAITEELLKGRDLSKQLLQLVLHRHHDQSNDVGSDEGSLLWISFAQDLVNNILTSFSNTLLLFHSFEIPIDASAKSDQDRHDLDDHAVKRFNTRNGRGCHPRKRAMKMWEKKSPILVDDGYAWRKYGQKRTMNAEYLRNYYRCSHKHDQGCPAMKQVQRIRERPPLYRTTYFGIHTCKTHQLLSQNIPLEYASSGNLSESSLLLSFNDTSLPAGKQDHSYFSSTKKELQQISSIDVKQNPESQHEHVAAVLSPNLDQFSLVKVQPIEVDDVVLKSPEFDESVHIGPGFGFITESRAINHRGFFLDN
ncbi:probable WRKY transcription factor 70 [Prosopis cineraria]|uniref:probable WRKY transcription factor 70 n=1 Tax=Prosopis cineraria TaxID=364024 RepID=UPI00240F4FBF|nr:probable WRKY transcription factor 70 [Prosopis cineraria]